jgi:heat shock protein HslJ
MSVRRLGALGVLVMALVAACTPGPGSGGQLEATKWVLNAVSIGGVLTVVPDDEYVDAEFDSRRVSGFGGCNTYDAFYQAGARTLFVTQPRSTLMACAQPSMDLETAYLAALNNSRSFTERAGELVIFDGDRNTILRFDAAPRNPLLGKWVVDSYGIPPSTVTAVLPDTALDIAFGIVSVGGFAGCNSFSGTYGTNGNVVRISQLATTRLACEQPVMDQETAFLAALGGVARIDSRGNQLNLEDRDGHLLVALVRPSTEEPGASASPGASQPASAKPSPSPKPSASAAASASPTAKPTATPTSTPKPTAAPTATPKPSSVPTTVPSAPPSIPPSFPATAQCKLQPTDGSPVVATLVYPGSWHTLTEPVERACRFFDPNEIDPNDTPLVVAVQADVAKTAYPDAVTAATDPAAWTVASTSEFNVQGAPVTCVAAVAVTDAAGIPAGTNRFACLASVGSAGTVTIWATGASDQEFLAKSAVVNLMTLLSTFVAQA